MAGLSTKADPSFFRKIVVGAVGARAVCDDLERLGHQMAELENGAIGVKIWKDVKRKRVRIPDLVCVQCGLRIESRAKTSPALTMSHSIADAERAWDYGMVDNDLIAFPICEAVEDATWSAGQLESDDSYYHSMDRVRWKVHEYVNYFPVADFRRVVHTHSATKGVTEGLETSISWDAIFSTRAGVVEKVTDDDRVAIRRTSDGHLYTWVNKKDLPVVVSEGDSVKENQVIASSVIPVSHQALACPQTLAAEHISYLLQSPERTQRFTGIKLARLRGEPDYEDEVFRIASHPDEDMYIQLEGLTYLASVCGHSAKSLFHPFLNHPDAQVRLEAVVALAETATAEATELLSVILHGQKQPLHLRSAAAWALGRIASDQAIESLVQAFNDVEQDIREEALEVVSSIGNLALDILQGNVTHSELNIAAGAAEAIRRQATVPPSLIQSLVDDVKTKGSHHWPVWLLGHLPQDATKTFVAELQDENPEAHYAISVLWSFVESWIAKHWDAHPEAKFPVDEGQ